MNSHVVETSKNILGVYGVHSEPSRGFWWFWFGLGNLLIIFIPILVTVSLWMHIPIVYPGLYALGTGLLFLFGLFLVTWISVYKLEI